MIERSLRRSLLLLLLVGFIGDRALSFAEHGVFTGGSREADLTSRRRSAVSQPLATAHLDLRLSE